MAILILGLVLFLGIHCVSIVAPAWRDAKVASMGLGTWKGIYSVISLIGFVLICYGYYLARPEAETWYVLPRWVGSVNMIFMALAFVLLVASQFPAGTIKAMAKHPMLLAVKLWAVAHLLVNGDTASIVLFGSFLAWAIVDRISVKRRGVALPEKGPTENDVKVLGAGLLLFAVFIWQVHVWLFGVVPLYG